MNGIEKITARIEADTQAEIDRILGEARGKADEIREKYRARAEAEAASQSARNKKSACEREERLVSVAQMEARKVILSAKQEMVEKAYDLALEKLIGMPEEEYEKVLTALMVRASSSGREEVIFSAKDRERAGKAAVKHANEILARGSGPELPEGKSGAVPGKAAGVSAMSHGTAMLTVSEETRNISGGFILKEGNIEVNCTFETLVRLQKAETSGAVARQLFPEG